MAGVRQFSISAKDEVGALAELTKGLAYEGVNIRGILVAQEADGGRIRLVVEDSVKAERVLVEQQVDFEITPVLAVGMKNSPGALHSVAEKLAENHINIEYVYTLLPKAGQAVAILKVTDAEEAADLLTKDGARILGEHDL